MSGLQPELQICEEASTARGGTETQDNFLVGFKLLVPFHLQQLGAAPFLLLLLQLLLRLLLHCQKRLGSAVCGGMSVQFERDTQRSGSDVSGSIHLAHTQLSMSLEGIGW
jgi:hypothetical protein